MAFHLSAAQTANGRNPSVPMCKLRSGWTALVIVTDWNEYRHPDFGRIKETLKTPVLVDGRNLYDARKMKSLGFTYASIGRGGTS